MCAIWLIASRQKRLAFRRMTQTAGIVGSGLIGRLLALSLVEKGWQIDLYDRDDEVGTHSCAYTGAGMLAPWSELEMAEPLLTRLGITSLSLWEDWLAKLVKPVFFQRSGTLIVSHRNDYPELERLSQTLARKINTFFPEHARPSFLFQDNIQTLEPALVGRFQRGFYLPDEGQIDNRQLLRSMAATLKHENVRWKTNTEIRDVIPYRIQEKNYDWVIDCRGLGAKKDWKNLRGVRGELIRVSAPDVLITRPVRLMHPRYPLYIVPRENHHYLIGATSIETDEMKPVTVQSALELLSAAYSVHPGFSEAAILEMIANCRPALPNHLPEIQASPGLLRINGLYRHGFMIAPALVEQATRYLQNRILNAEDSENNVIHEEMPAYATCG